MSAYQTVVVGTDGSDSSLRAVDRAAKIAGPDAKLIIASAYLPQSDDARAADVLKEESYKVTGTAPIYEILHTAKERAHKAGAKNVEPLPATDPACHLPGPHGRAVPPGPARPAGCRQCGSEHDCGPVAGIGAGQRVTPGQGRRADRAHHLICT